MLTTPYSIYINKRPVRVAFLIEDKPESLAIIDAILAYNRDRWGGRYNPIVITDGQKLTDAWWLLLEAVDPDIVASFMTLSDDLIANIERRISPYFINQLSRGEQGEPLHIHVSDEGLSVLPTPCNVRAASWGLREPCLVLFQMDWKKTEPLIKRFAEWNFGGYSYPIDAVNRELERVHTQSYPVTHAASLVTPLTELSTFKPFTYPIQLCSIPKEALPDVEYNHFGEAFEVVIGDTPTDVTYFWNRPATIPQWIRKHLKQVWLPVSLATDAQLTTALGSWLERAADPNGSYQGRIRFVSLSLPQEELQKIVEPLTSKLHIFKHVNALQQIQPPKIREGFLGPHNQEKMDLYRATSRTEQLTLREPEVQEGPMLGQHWMADLYIEYQSEHCRAVSGRPLWWQLPRLNALASQMFRRPARILRSRYPSVLMKRGEPRLNISLLDDTVILSMLAALPYRPYYTVDVRHDKTFMGRTPYYRAQHSEKGRYLSGLLDLFGGLDRATYCLEERYWRRMFDLLSGRTAHTDAELLKKVGNALSKHLGANRAQFYENDKSMAWLTNYVLKLARSLPVSSRDLEFRIFEEQAKQEMEDFNASRSGEKPWVYSHADLAEALANLTKRSIILIGIQARCPSCGYRAWHHIDDAKQILHCGGCNAAFPMPPEQRWHYRLNSLARAAYAEHGLLPVILVLGQLFMDARSTFLFAPCLNLFEKVDKGAVGDLDIAVILDGQFVIGEVKQSRNLFDEATFVKMEGIARRLLPDVLLFASMDHEPTSLITREIGRLSEVLRPLSINVQWYQLHQYKFDPSPVR